MNRAQFSVCLFANTFVGISETLDCIFQVWFDKY